MRATLPLIPSDPSHLGGWRLTGRLGAGGIGVVYLGVDENDRRAAVKVMAPGLAHDATFRQRFGREVEICRRVEGDKVAKLLDADPDADIPWLAVEFVAGPNLLERISSASPLTGDDLSQFAASVLDGLAQLHIAGVVHRDLKPANVLMSADGPVLVDFGIAAAVDATIMTRAGTALGSAGWMAPEQVRGAQASFPADVWAWGTLVAFAATGKAPFGGGPADAVIYRSLREEPDLRGVPTTLSAAVAAALAKEPERRPTVDALLAHFAGRPLDLPSPASAPTIVETGGEAPTAVTPTWAPPTTPPVDIGVGPARPGATARPRRRAMAWAASLILVVALASGVGVVLAGRGSNGAADDERPSAAQPGGDSVTTVVTAAPPSNAQPAPMPTPSTTVATTTTTTVPPVPEMVADVDPASDDVDDFVNFADAHQQQVVRLDLRFTEVWNNRVLDVNPDDQPARVYARGDCPLEAMFCEGGAEVAIADLHAVPDATLHYEHGAWRLNGRFAVQGLSVHQGIFSVQLRAVPAG